jgi:glycosyltransferase involved in cell wall biosynthesis
MNQRRIPDEIIISDDNSIDSTMAICTKYKDKIKLFQNENGPSGFVNGWNNAISKATSDFISVLHQDDMLEPSFLEEVEQVLKQYPDVKHLFVPCNYIDENNQIIRDADYCDGKVYLYTGKEYVKAYQTVGYPHIHRCPGVITHRSIFEKMQYNPAAGHIADDDFFYRVGMYTDVLGIMKPLASYRMHKTSETGQLNDAVLVKRLIDDYSFQVKQWKGSDFVNGESYDFFVKNLRKFKRRYLGYAIKQLNIIKIIYALK